MWTNSTWWNNVDSVTRMEALLKLAAEWIVRDEPLVKAR